MPVFAPGTSIATAEAVIEVEGLAAGTHRFRLEVEDEAGNRSAPDERIVTVRAPVPVVAGLRPAFGAWGDAVAVAGAGFDPTPQKNEVTFNGVRTDVAQGTATELQVRVPQPATTGRVSVRNAAGEAASPRPFVIPVTFVVRLGGPGPVDLAADARRNEVWVLHGTAGADLGSVSVVALKTRELLATIATQRGPREIAVAPAVDRQAAAVTNGLASTTTLIDVAARQVRGHVRVEPNPVGVAFRPDGRIAYVACRRNDAAGPGAVLAIDALEARVVARIEAGPSPARVVFSPDGKLAFVNNTGNGTVSVIDANAHRLVEHVKVGGTPESKPSEVAVGPETFPLFVANPGTRNASIVQSSLGVQDVDAGFAVSAAAISAPGKRGWLSGPDERLVLTGELGTGALRKLRSGGAGGGPKSVVPTPDGRGVFVANPDAGEVTVLDADSLAIQALVPAPGIPTRGIAAVDGAFACFLCIRTGELLAIETGSVLG